MIKKDKVIVIIASYNGQLYWPELMPVLSRENYQDFTLEILVVDNNSTDNSVSYLQTNYPQVKIIANQTNLGFVGANNLGYQYAQEQGANFIYLLNQDTIVQPGWLGPLYDFAKQNKFGSLQSKLLLWPAQEKINTVGNVIHFLGFGFGRKSNKLDRGEEQIRKIDYASGAGVFMALEVLQKLGGLFDETMFMYLEDLDLGWSLNLLGYDNYLIPQSIIYHKYEFNRSMKQVYWFERNRLWIMLKNYKIPTLLLIFPAWLIMELGQLFYAFLKGYLGQKLRAYSFLFSGRQWKILRQKRAQRQAQRQRSDRQVVYKFSGRILFQPLNSFILRLANLFFGLYWLVIKQIIFW
jgi:GT2 family glycosyltransferase